MTPPPTGITAYDLGYVSDDLCSRQGGQSGYQLNRPDRTGGGVPPPAGQGRSMNVEAAEALMDQHLALTQQMSVACGRQAPGCQTPQVVG